MSTTYDPELQEMVTKLREATGPFGYTEAAISALIRPIQERKSKERLERLEEIAKQLEGMNR